MMLWSSDSPDLDQNLATDSMNMSKDSRFSPDKRVAEVRACDAAQSCEDEIGDVAISIRVGKD